MRSGGDSNTERAAKGGAERAKKLSKERRREIAKAGAEARWGRDLMQATHEGEIDLGGGRIRIACAVLPSGKRLLSQGTFLRAIGRSRTPKAGTGGLSTVDGLPTFLQANALNPFINDELRASTTPILYRDAAGKRTVGYDAELLPMVAEVYLRFRDACNQAGESVPRQYEHIVAACDIATRGLARVGIIALVDEATGYQADRARKALAEILEKFISAELRRWVKTFPDGYFKELCRLKGVQFRSDMKLPQYFGHLTKDIIYKRLAPAVLRELEERNPRTASGKRANKHHQWLSCDVGHPKLLEHLGLVVGVMKLSDDFQDFKKKLDRVAPVYRDAPLFKGVADDL